MTSPDHASEQSTDQLKKLRERINRSSRKLAGMERSLKNLKNQHELVLRELDLTTSGQREEAEVKGGVITRIMDYIIEIKDILEIMKTTILSLSDSEDLMAGKCIQFEDALLKSNETIMETIERYRILSQLGELDTKILSLKFNGIPIHPKISREVLKLRSSILTEEVIPVEELQERSLKLFRAFANNIESAIETASYQPEKRKILESMREVSWM